MRAKPRNTCHRGVASVTVPVAEVTPRRLDSRGFARMARSYNRPA